MAELRATLDSLRNVHRELAEAPDPYGPREGALRALLERRDDLVKDLGVVLLRAVAEGATLTVTPPWPELNREHSQEGKVTATPAPVAPPPTEAPAAVGPEDPTILDLDPSLVPAPPPPPPPPPARSTRRDLVRDIPRVEILRDTAPREPPPPPKRTPRPPPTDLRGILEMLGKPSRLTRTEDGVDLVERLVDATSNPDRWLGFPQDTQRSLVGLVSSVARHVQDEADVDLPETTWTELRAWFPMMTKWSKLYRPGFVPGLSRRNDPERGSWISDAEYWWWVLVDTANGVRSAGKSATPAPAEPTETTIDDEPPPADAADALREVTAALADPASDLGRVLQRAQEAGLAARDPKLLKLLMPHEERIKKLSGLKTLKSALKGAKKGDEPIEDAQSDERLPAVVPADWPYLGATTDKIAIVFGGDRRPEAAERMREAFGFASCTWEETDPRRVASLVSRIRARTVDLVILLRRYVAHAESDALVQACKEASVPYVAVDQGYGVGQVRLAIERYLRGRVEATSN